MQQKIHLSLLPGEAEAPDLITRFIARSLGVSDTAVTGYTLLKKSIDARAKVIRVQLHLLAFINEPFVPPPAPSFHFADVRQSRYQVVIAGAGPAGLFAALRLIAGGVRPVILERGKNVRDRRRDLAALNREGLLNPESNYCFGEGGAGTYSDGKLYTRSHKRGNIERILQTFVHFGASHSILYEAHPHIGTNKLPGIITAMREQILACGGEIHFNTRMTGLEIRQDRVRALVTGNGDHFAGDAFVLATGHSARDVFGMLHAQNLSLIAKPFALGVRVEHPQQLINEVQYGALANSPYLPPASYSLVEQVEDRGVFSFCMCPGGIIAPAATASEELVVNGWSPSRRNNPFANSGLVVQTEIPDVTGTLVEKGLGHVVDSPLAMMYYQQEVERKAFHAGGGKLVAPAQRLVDFTKNVLSTTLPACSYLPGVRSAPLQEVLPEGIARRLQKALRAFAGKMPRYFTNEAMLVAAESRTSSPVRIPRDPEGLHHPQLQNLFPCGEGAGYAGGIVSAAMDGERVADRISAVLPV